MDSRKLIRARLFAGCLGALLAAAVVHAGAATVNARKPMTIIVPFSPGGSTDVQARLVAKALTERTGRSIIVDNRPGAGGSIGAKIAASAAPDGNTILFASTSSLVSEPVLRAKEPIDVLRDFTPITQITDMPMLFVVASSSPFQNVAGFVAQARKRPGDMTYASWGKGSVGNILGEMFKLSTRTEAIHIPYKGEALGVTEVIGGQVISMFVTPVNIPHIRSGKLRALAVTGEKRISALPDVPTFIESGYKGIDLPMWFGFVAPLKTPPETIARLHQDVVNVLKTPEFSRWADSLALTVLGSTPAEFARRIRTDADLVARLAKVADLKLDQ